LRNKLRRDVLSFFETKGHLRSEPSFSLIPQHDLRCSVHKRRYVAHEELVYREEELGPPAGLHLSEVHPHADIENIGKTGPHATLLLRCSEISASATYFNHEAIAGVGRYF
jgi:alanyl-tRNA synthetase